MRAAIGCYALTAGLLRRYQFTPAPRDFFSVMTHDSRMPPTAYSLKMGFTQRSRYFVAGSIATWKFVDLH